MDKYKEGIDFEWVKADNGNYKTRRFFTKAEKEAKKAPKMTKEQVKSEMTKPVQKKKPKPSSSSAPTKSKRPVGRKTPMENDLVVRLAREAINKAGPKRNNEKRAEDAMGRLPSKEERTLAETRKVKPKETEKPETVTLKSGKEVKRGKTLGELFGISKKREGAKKILAEKSAQENKPKVSRSQERKNYIDNFVANNSGMGSKAEVLRAANESWAQYSKKSGYNKGGMVKSNCGASMKPTQKWK